MRADAPDGVDAVNTSQKSPAQSSTGTAVPVSLRPLDRARSLAPELDWGIAEEEIAAIEELKASKNAIILAHNYMTPDIYHGVADIKGDSLGLARQAAETDADIIVFAGVHFMAETAKITSPDKKVLIPDLDAGCSLAESITAADVRAMRAKHPGAPVVTYVNTSAAVKAETDICCTSSNAVEVVESLGVDKVIFLPDQYLGRYVATQTDVEIVLWDGACEVHERFTGQELRDYRSDVPGIAVIAHPECPPDVLAEADFVGSTAGMIGYVQEKLPPKVVMVTECSMSDNIAAELPEVDFIRPCNLCPHMKRISLSNIRAALEFEQHEVHIDPEIAARALKPIEAMLQIGGTR